MGSVRKLVSTPHGALQLHHTPNVRTKSMVVRAGGNRQTWADTSRAGSLFKEQQKNFESIELEIFD